MSNGKRIGRACLQDDHVALGVFEILGRDAEAAPTSTGRPSFTVAVSVDVQDCARVPGWGKKLVGHLESLAAEMFGRMWLMAMF